MNCEQAVDLLTRPVEEGTAALRRTAAEHAAACEDCRMATMAVHALRLASMAPVPASRPEARERATRSPASRPHPGLSPRGRFWLGTAVGAALAASLALAVVWFDAPAPDTGSAATPHLQMLANETRDVSISLTTATALEDARIRVTLSGGVDLVGYTGTRELEWRANLDAGANQLTLPIVATGADRGQVMVEVIHEGRHRTFLVDVDIETPV